MARPRKPAAIRQLEGNRSKRPIPAEPPLHGTPELPGWLESAAVDHFNFLAAEFGGAGVLKRADGPALAMLADLWAKYWAASASADIDAMCKLKQRWDSAAAKLGIQVVDRARLMIAAPADDDPADSFFKVTG